MNWEQRSWVLAGLIGVALTTQGVAAERDYALDGFTKVSASRGIEVEIITGEAFNVEAWASRERLLRRFDISVKGRWLDVSRRSGPSFFLFGATDRYKVTVTMPELDELAASSGAEIMADGLSTDDLAIAVSSGASVELPGLRADSIDIDISSGADVSADGTCRAIRVSASSGADMEGKGLSCQKAVLDASSGADIELAVSETLRGEVSSGGDIEIHGSPEVTQLSESSGGDVDFNN